jgi:hypothetical protein
MSYEIHPDGSVRADTADEVVAVWSKLKKPLVETRVSKQSAPVSMKPCIEVSKPSCVEDSWSIFTKALSAEWHVNQRHVLSTLKKQGAPIHRDAFIQALGPVFRTINVVGGTVAGISKQARKAGLDLATIVIREGMTYRPGPLLRERPLPWDDAA